ncbi:MAG: outer membrane beta-barrel protein [Acidobacteria bacterium]|nr:outer membrane beta-barrel protein [Acidobacteriota bacterium]
MIRPISLRTPFAALVLLCAGFLLPDQASGQPAGQGSILGFVFDANTGEPIRGAQVSLDGQTDNNSRTDLDGTYRFNLAPGTYSVTVTAEKFLPAKVEGIVVTAGEIADGSVVLSTETEVTTVEVVATVEASTATAEALIAERKLAPVVSDGISHEEIKNSTASDAAGAVEKVTGVSVVEGGYVYVRGLGERYSSTMLNNAMLPTTEPERRVVPLDLFPASLLNDVKVLKTYTPDMPGEFAGGVVKLETVEFPRQKIFTVGTTIGFNSRTTFKPGDTYRGGSRDFFGFDDGTRDLPSLVPQDGRVFPGAFTPQEFQEIGRAFPNNWQPVPQDSVRPTVGYSIAGGNTWGKLGVVGAITFTNKLQRQSELLRYLVNTGGGNAAIFTDYPDYVADSESVRLGGVMNLAYSINPSHKLIFRNTLTRETDKEARTFSGLNGGIDTVIQDQRLRWVERSLVSTGLEGQHSFNRLHNSLFTWQLTYSTSKRDEPDFREVVRTLRPDGTTPYLASPQSGTRFYNYLTDHIIEPQASWATPFYGKGFSGKVEVGFRGTFRDRDFAARRFRFVPLRLSQLDLTAPSDELFAPENITPDLFQIRENTRGTDQYTAAMDVYAGYAMVDLSFGAKWRVVGGVRVEDAVIDVETLDPLIPGAVPAVSTLANRDPLPGVNVIYALSPKSNLRFGYSETLSRPDFRELSPFDFVNVLGGYSFAGNPNLVRAKIKNFDARWEHFFGGSQLVAASYFYKDFTNPIEVTIQPTTGDLRQSYINAAGGTNQGVEFELRRSLAVLNPKLAQFNVQANLTLVDSQVQLGEAQRNLLTSLQRPMMGQSKVVYNLITEWLKPRWRSNARFYVNHVSRRITDVGALGLPDVYQQGNTFLDFVYQYSFREDGRWNMRFTAENLTDNHYQWIQADITQRSFRLGRTYSVGTTYSF